MLGLVKKEVLRYIEHLNNEYKKTGRTFYIRSVGNGYQLVLRKEYGKLLLSLKHKKRKSLSKHLLETLAVVAYHQPVSKKEIDKRRGANSTYTLKRLKEMGFINISERSKDGSYIYMTTSYFLVYFGLNSLESLPPLNKDSENFQKHEDK